MRLAGLIRLWSSCWVTFKFGCLLTVSRWPLNAFMHLRNLMNFLSVEQKSRAVDAYSRHLHRHWHVWVIEIIALPICAGTEELVIVWDIECGLCSSRESNLPAYFRLCFNFGLLNLWNVSPFNVSLGHRLVFSKVIAEFTALVGDVLVQVTVDTLHEGVEAIVVVCRGTASVHFLFFFVNLDFPPASVRKSEIIE